jgi:hypothetical protein
MDRIKRLLREGLLKEKSISDVSLHDFNVKEIIKYWLMSSTETPVMMYKYEMQDDYNLSPEEKEELMDADEDDILETDSFKKWLEYEVESKIDDFTRGIDEYFNDDDTITLWRKMTVDEKWIRNLKTTGKRLGKYWSYVEDAAEAHWGGAGMTITLQTSVREEYIDWNQTIEANINPQTGEDEKEITLFKNTPIKIEALWVNDENINIQYLNDKTFLA